MRRSGPHVRILRVRPKVRKLAAEEGRQAEAGAPCSFPAPPPPPASQPASQPQRPAAPSRRRAPRSALGACSRPRPRQASPSPPGGASEVRARARPLPLPGEPPPFATRPSSLPLPLPARRPTACELLRRRRLPGRRCAPRRAPTCQARPPAVSQTARRLLQALAHRASPVAAAALPGPRQVYKHQPGARFPGSTSPSPSSSQPSRNIHFRARSLDRREQPERG